MLLTGRLLEVMVATDVRMLASLTSSLETAVQGLVAELLGCMLPAEASSAVSALNLPGCLRGTG